MDVVFLGDSITEAWRGTSYGQPSQRAQGIPLVFHQEFGRIRSLCLAISGDQTQHLLWRLMNGELPAALRPKVFVILIGTNNLGAGMGYQQAASGVMAVVEFLRQERPDTPVVLNLLFPRGSSKPRSSVTDSRIEQVNQQLRQQADGLQGVTLLNCNGIFERPLDDGVRADIARVAGVELAVEQRQVNSALMPDLLHPYGACCERTQPGQSRETCALTKSQLAVGRPMGLHTAP